MTKRRIEKAKRSSKTLSIIDDIKAKSAVNAERYSASANNGIMK